jgi:hypothetical protein
MKQSSKERSWKRVKIAAMSAGQGFSQNRIVAELAGASGAPPFPLTIGLFP